MAAYRVLAGLDYAGKRVEAGAIVDDLPSKSITWLLDQGLIEKADKPNREPQSPSKEA